MSVLLDVPVAFARPTPEYLRSDGGRRIATSEQTASAEELIRRADFAVPRQGRVVHFYVYHRADIRGFGV